MADFTDNNQDQNQQTGQVGEIFSSDSQSAYEKALNEQQNTEEPESKLQTPFVPEEQPYQNPIGENMAEKNIPPPVEPPPPYSTDNKKQFIIFALFALILIIIGVALFGFIARLRNHKPDSKEVTLTYWGLWEEEVVYRPLIDEYHKNNPNVKINYIKQDPKDYRERLQSALDRGENIDIFRFHNSWIPMFINAIAPIPKTVMSDQEYEDAFYSVIQSDMKVNESYYGIPLMIDGLLMFYNEDILKNANVTVPQNWSQVREIVPKLTVKQNNKIITSAIALGTAENIEYFSDILGLMMMQNGTKLSKSLYSCIDELSQKCSEDALTFYREFAELPNNSWDDTLENSLVAFANGKVALVFAPSYAAYDIKLLLAQGNKTLNFRTAQVPQLPCETAVCPAIHWATYWVEGVSKNSQNQEEAFKFLKFLSSSDSLQKLFNEQVKVRELFGEPFPRKELAKNLSNHVYLAPLIEEAPNMTSFYTAARTFDGETGINSTLNKYLKDAINSLSQGTSIETAVKTIDTGFAEIYSRFGLASSN
jgi:multiple sugar transport system substrate-binding protein